MIIAPRDFRDEEFKTPYEYLTSLGHKVVVASTDTTVATGLLDMKVKPDLKIDSVDTLAFDALILVGGSGSVIYWDNQTVHQLVKHFARPPKLLAAICLATVTLARAGVLKGKEATAFKDRNTIDELKKGGATYIDKDVVISSNIITASGPKAADKFAKAIATALEVK
jgi:protease I